MPQIVFDLFTTVSTLKRQLNPSKSTEQETTKVGYITELPR